MKPLAPEDPFYAPLYVWEARGDVAPTDHTDWDIVETHQPRHRATPDHRATGRGLTYRLRTARPETSWGHLDDYKPTHTTGATP